MSKADRVKVPQETDDSQEKFSLFTLCTHMAPNSLMLTVRVDDVLLNLELDTGAAVLIVSRRTCMGGELEQAAGKVTHYSHDVYILVKNWWCWVKR